MIIFFLFVCFLLFACFSFSNQFSLACWYLYCIDVDFSFTFDENSHCIDCDRREINKFFIVLHRLIVQLTWWRKHNRVTRRRKLTRRISWWMNHFSLNDDESRISRTVFDSYSLTVKSLVIVSKETIITEIWIAMQMSR